MRIAIVGINFAPEPTGISVYTTGMAEFLACSNNSVTVYTAFSYYPAWSKSVKDRGCLFRKETVGAITIRRSYLYVPSRPSAVKRMFHELSFVASATLNYLFGPRADCTIIVSPPLFLGIPVALIARLKGSKSIFHVQDLQPDAAIDLGMLKTGRFTDLLHFIERLTYRIVDRVSTISEGMRNKIISKDVVPEKVFLLRNWANDNNIAPLPKKTEYRRELRLDKKFVVLYSGNMGVKQGLSVLLEAAALLKSERDIVYLIAGDGGMKKELQIMANALKLTNVLFLPVQPYENLSALLATADISIIPQKMGINDIVLPSKLSNIMASRRPLIATAPRNSEFGRIVLESDCGILVEPENAQQVADAIMTLYRNPAELERKAANGRYYMEQHLGHYAILNSFATQLEEIVAG